MASHTSHLIVATWITGCLSIVSLNGAVSLAADDVPSAPSILQVEHVMYSDPSLPTVETQLVISNEAIPLWLVALSRPDAQLQRVAVDTIAIANRRGMSGIEVALPKLIELAGQGELDSTVRRAVVRALIELDARDQAPLLAQLAREHGTAISANVEPALVKWKSPELALDWIERLNDPGSRRQSLIVAIEGLGALERQDASTQLTRYLRDAFLSTGLRMAAARSLGQIQDSGLDQQAADLIDGTDESIASDLLAIALLSRHTDAKSTELLKSLMTRKSTVVQSESLGRLYEIDFKKVLEFSQEMIVSRDANVRRTVARALIDSKEVARIAPLATLLDDVNPGLRREVAAALVDLAQISELRDEIIAQTSGVLDQDSWRGCEQAALVLISLDHQQISDRLVDLIRHPRGEVMVTAGWGLCRFGQKKHLPAMLGRAKEIYEGFQTRKLTADSAGVVELMAHLFQAFAQMEYHEADELVRAYVPRNFSLGERSRSAAAWCVGFLYRGQAPEDVLKLLLGRLNDVKGLEPEFDSVRQMCAQSLGRMNAEASLPDLRNYANESVSRVSRSCHWAIELMTGEKPPPLPLPRSTDYDDWFLKPVAADELTDG